MLFRPLLDAILGRLLRHGRLTLVYPDFSERDFGTDPAPHVTVAVRRWRTVRGLVTNPALVFGEAFVAGDLVPVGCGIEDVLDLVYANIHEGGRHPGQQVRRAIGRLLRRLAQFNPIPRARRNAAHHYDLDGALYALFLDQDRQYSCAYFTRGDESLEEAQQAKKRHVAAKLLLDRPDLHVLDIGCGWGGMALTLARDYGARVTGITLSQEQLVYARARAEQEGLSHRVHFDLLDYRNVTGPFDRIVSVGMFEHVGITHYRHFFGRVHALLAEDGIALIHAIGRSDGPNVTNPWLTRGTRAVGCNGLRNPPPALRAHHCALASPFRHQPGEYCVTLRRAVLPDVRPLSRRQRTDVQASRPHGLATAADPAARCRATDTRLSAAGPKQPGAFARTRGSASVREGRKHVLF